MNIEEEEEAKKEKQRRKESFGYSNNVNRYKPLVCQFRTIISMVTRDQEDDFPAYLSDYYIQQCLFIIRNLLECICKLLTNDEMS